MGYLDIYLSTMKTGADEAPQSRTYDLPGLKRDAQPTAEEIERARNRYKLLNEEYQIWKQREDEEVFQGRDVWNALECYRMLMKGLIAKYGEGVINGESK